MLKLSKKYRNSLSTLWFKSITFCFSSLKGIAEDENYEYYYYDGLKEKSIFLIRKEYGLVDSFPIVDKYFQGNTSLDDIREVYDLL